MSAAPRMRTAWSPADTSHQGAFWMSFMARSSIFRLSTLVLHGFGELDIGQLLPFAEVENMHDLLPGDIRGSVDDDGEHGFPGFLVVALHRQDRVYQFRVRRHIVLHDLAEGRACRRIPAHEDSNFFEDDRSLGWALLIP